MTLQNKMERIYFDKQIFSNLFRGDKPLYKKFLKDILDNKSKFLFCYSHGHMLDLKNDKTEIKYEELAFMERIVNDNYLSYHAIEKRTSCYLAKPSEVFKDIQVEDEPFSFSNFLNDIDLTYATPEQANQIQLATDILKNQKLDFGLSKIKNFPSEYTEPLKKFLPIGVGTNVIHGMVGTFYGIFKDNGG